SLHFGSTDKRRRTTLARGVCGARGPLQAAFGERERDAQMARKSSLCFLWKVRGVAGKGVAFALGASYFESRRGTEPQRARPLRCEAAPPTKEGFRAGRSGFLKRPGSASLLCCPRRPPTGASIRAPLHWMS